MISLAVRSLRHRATAFTATFVSIFLATALIGSFATVFETSRGPMSAVDRDTLSTMGLVVGAWGTAIALFSLASTLAITVRQRDVEIATLRTLGSTPRQARRMIRVETLLVAVVGSALGAVVAWFCGPCAPGPGPWGRPGRRHRHLRRRGRLGRRHRAGRRRHQPRGRHHRLASRHQRPGASGPHQRPLRLRPDAVVAGARCPAPDRGTASRWRSSRSPWSANSEDPMAAMATSGSSCILVGLGLALLAPTLLRWSSALTGPLVGRLGSPATLLPTTLPGARICSPVSSLRSSSSPPPVSAS
ncbi:ABC transporter permease [Nocardioides alcanivorans]|uniref:ABC transporter permease n=1 Tax=Nocardioides alcanivorans TaxID=2897352 RepID=UPI001F44C166|nr:FtsX-like permease family protein [Nocardioides alcanivorans]